MGINIKYQILAQRCVRQSLTVMKCTRELFTDEQQLTKITADYDCYGNHVFYYCCYFILDFCEGEITANSLKYAGERLSSTLFIQHQTTARAQGALYCKDPQITQRTIAPL